MIRLASYIAPRGSGLPGSRTSLRVDSNATRRGRKTRQSVPAQRCRNAEIRWQQAVTGAHCDRARTNIFAGTTVVGADPDLPAIEAVDSNAILLHDHCVSALGH
jgi:hypothetical protein